MVWRPQVEPMLAQAAERPPGPARTRRPTRCRSRRCSAAPRPTTECRRPGRAVPAYFVAFDVLQQDGQELLTRPCSERRALLEELFTPRALTALWSPVRPDPVAEVSADRAIDRGVFRHRSGSSGAAWM